MAKTQASTPRPTVTMALSSSQPECSPEARWRTKYPMVAASWRRTSPAGMPGPRISSGTRIDVS